ncbi:MAG: methylated-DNA--[protein]-cysteine S-methyltransferase [Chloroflexota bacterium]
MEYTVLETDMGWIAIVGSERGLVSTSLPHKSAREALESLGKTIEYALPSPDRFMDLTRRLKAYFSGYKVLFQDELDFSETTQFQREVWQAARLIPYGETRSYGWLADRVGKPGAARAIGQAMGKNRLPIIIPCHRVIGNNGSLGGFSGGLDMKKRLLRLEAATTSPQP